MAALRWEPEAGRTYDALQDRDSRLLDAVDDVLDNLEDDPGSPLMRRQARRTTRGDAIWRVPIRPRSENWALLWMDDPARPGDVLILYVGPASYDR